MVACSASTTRSVLRPGSRLVWEYFDEDIDPRRVHQALGSLIRDLPPYLEAVRRFAEEPADAAPAETAPGR